MNEALDQLGYDYEFEIVSNIADIVESGVSKTPAMIINGKILFEGHVPSILEMPDIIKKAVEK